MQVSATCHVHSDWSYDGSWPLDTLASAFARRGARVLMMTEHDRGFSPSRLAEYRHACASVSSDRILVVPGIEYSDAENRVHVLVWGPVPFLGEKLETGALLARVARYDGVAVLAHPCRRAAWKCFKPEWGSHLVGIEAWNRKYDGWSPGRHALLTQSSAVPFVGLDFHTSRQLFPLAMGLRIPGNIDEDSVLDCLRGRRCEAQAFGLALQERRLRAGLPLLHIAERGRRTLAALARSTRVTRPA